MKLQQKKNRRKWSQFIVYFCVSKVVSTTLRMLTNSINKEWSKGNEHSKHLCVSQAYYSVKYSNEINLNNFVQRRLFCFVSSKHRIANVVKRKFNWQNYINWTKINVSLLESGIFFFNYWINNSCKLTW